MTIIRKQLDMLHNQIVGKNAPTGKDKIFVYPIEAGLGKTVTAVEALLCLYEEDPTKKSLIVTQTRESTEKIEKELDGIGLAVHGKKNEDDKAVLSSLAVATTHSRYKYLCDDKYKNNHRYKRLIEGRTNLIIDEEFHPIEFAHVNLDGYIRLSNTIESIDSRLTSSFEEIFSPIRKVLIRTNKEEYTSLKILKPFPVKLTHKMKLDQIRSKVLSMSEKYKFFAWMKQIDDGSMDNSYAVSYKYLKNIFDDLCEIFKSPFCICDNRGIYCIKSSVKYNLLENNVMLDASASILSLYENSEQVEVQPMRRIVIHNNWTLNVCNVKSSKNAKLFRLEFYEDIAKLIELKCSNPDNRILIVGSADDVGGKFKPEGRLQRYQRKCCEDNKKQLSYANFGSMRGANTWSAYNCIIIIHTPYRPAYYYPLVFNYYNPDYVLTSEKIQTSYCSKKGFEHPCYRDKKLDDFRESDLAASIYQAIKRINRDNFEEAEAYLISSNRNIVRILEKNLKGIKIKEHELDSQKRKSEMKRQYRRKEESPVRNELRELLIKMAKGEYIEFEKPKESGFYPKKWCMYMIGCNGHFSRYIKSVDSLMSELGISSNQHNVIIDKYTQKD